MENTNNESKNKLYEGTLSMSPKNIGYVRTKELDESIEVQTDNLGTGLHGDKVIVKITGINDYNNPTGEIIEVIRRAKFGYSGTLKKDAKGQLILEPSDPKMQTCIEIIDNEINAQEGDKIFVTIASWANQHVCPKGVITHILGKPFENNAEMLGISMEKGFDSNYPADVINEADEIKKNSTSTDSLENNLKNRKDIRGITTFTIDPADAKDFDDALSFQKLDNGHYEVGVHIADVSHYVTPGSALDHEAYKRQTSVYLVDRTIPMLPEVLSNDLCSLNPNEDKLTMSAMFEIDENGKIYKEWFGKTIMHSDKRFTYENAQENIRNQSGDFFAELTILNNIAKKLTQERMNAGAIALDQEEVKFKLDDNGVPIGVYIKERGDTNKLIEEFMLLANRKVAEYVAKKAEAKANIFVYRVHDLPNEDKMKELAEFLKSLGYPMKLKDGIIPSRDLNALMKKLEDSEFKDTVHTAVIRSMAKAIYSTKNIGHYGLAFKYYTHFTSPIRRYPDVMVHRFTQAYLLGEEVPEAEWASYAKTCDYASQREKEASDAERASIKYKQVEYMTYHIGETFDGVVTGLSRSGIFVEDKSTKCEGMIRLKDLGNDFFAYDEKKNEIIGRSTNKKFILGTKLKIKVVNADLTKKIIDYVIAQ
jgi:ribonuclease R